MKMKKYYPVLKSRAELWFSNVFNRQKWAEYVTAVQCNKNGLLTVPSGSFTLS